MHHHHPEPPTRRTFLNWAVNGIGAIFAALIGVPATLYLIDPRNRPTPPKDFRPVAGVRLGDVTVNVPVQGVIRNVRRDSWTLYPNDVIGRVWVRRDKPGTGADCFQVFSTVCPHLGCSINCNVEQTAFPFICPCHNGQWEIDGDRRPNAAGYENPAPRGMDTLEFDVARDPANPDEANRDLLLVKYVNFTPATPDKIARA